MDTVPNSERWKLVGGPLGSAYKNGHSLLRSLCGSLMNGQSQVGLVILAALDGTSKPIPSLQMDTLNPEAP